ncbi:hypothetical protein C499_00490 [Halogeometricum borinquense DSM 11551]|uniref:Uncharacterized protein n=1 Tax=Halogeometricum borinquense (strain ATCC 700274 / DSM 11551 / JCM 10706 / KCTC 4070 / PR3) TaxID=469382 RepID=L9V5T7_HALBP|nr:hypothetical protein [Halogeometricum borinquense]ELY31728.1 hypothetical protein C499_00490 [Halogeometricum borinquense DSM 11551]
MADDSVSDDWVGQSADDVFAEIPVEASVRVERVFVAERLDDDSAVGNDTLSDARGFTLGVGISPSPPDTFGRRAVSASDAPGWGTVSLSDAPR